MAPSSVFRAVPACWICEGTRLRDVATARFDLSEYRRQDPALAEYTGAGVAVARCEACGFAQPRALPALEGFFARMYDQRWSRGWMEEEFVGGAKDRIFRQVLRGLERRTPGRTLLDLGAHVGRLIHLAGLRGWRAEGVELNPATAGYAAAATGLPVHRADATDLAGGGRRWAAVTLVDVLEHIPRPVDALETARGLLEPGGWLAVKVPHGPNQLRKERLRERIFPGYRGTVADNLVHVSHFGPRSLRLALRRAGFAEVYLGAAAPEQVPGGVRAVAANALRLGVWAAARPLPADWPLALNLLAFARAP